MNEQEIKQIVEQAIDERFCCNGGECEAGFCRVRLDHIEQRLEVLISGTAEALNWIVAEMKKGKRHD